jgi:hypothetical protein
MQSEPIPEMTGVPAGDFLIGSDDGESDERPARRTQQYPLGQSLRPYAIGFRVASST